MKTYGWILVIKRMLRGNRFATFEHGSNVDSINKAQVWKVRQDAQVAKFSDETIRKVELFKNGKAKKIIPGR